MSRQGGAEWARIGVGRFRAGWAGAGESGRGGEDCSFSVSKLAAETFSPLKVTFWESVFGSYLREATNHKRDPGPWISSSYPQCKDEALPESP